MRNGREVALQAQRSVQEKDKGCSRHGAESPCTPGEARLGGCLPAAMEQISLCSHGGTYGVMVNRARRSSRRAEGGQDLPGTVLELPYLNTLPTEEGSSHCFEQS